jgi:hypothetical protein
MRISNAAALFSLATLGQAAPAIHGHKHAHTRDLGYGEGVKYQAGVFYVNWVSHLMEDIAPKADNKGHLRAQPFRHRSACRQIDQG